MCLLLQLYYLSACCHGNVIGIIVAGAAGSGKSSIIQTAVSALSSVQRPSTRRSASGMKTTHKLLRIIPSVTEDLSLIFGYMNDNKEWVDGIFTSTLKKASRVSI